ncbi:MAG: 50S ribosomal protein L2 [Candidatus Buchananbacteria bacterium RIFCSPHIGHO2_01_FULL_39_8]|uniref:Large ribosomal subunit protein uL2 n=1 Tax=Candidatus Buchananbacteria bacterium RIFCSPHIGHO2_01_FULL_39_8 TaxID=1797533 RepID=A0A1G1Y033_9BACT|nr:MAG: 50S ribosomal protein L2 [Candidatus Buchananbacteria bacterium RIFCSPHIGHO2_01_FULL_39_8]
MAIRIYKPTTPGRRQTSVDDFSDITKVKPEKKLIKIKKKTGGRNFSGKITVRHRGGGAKQFYRLIDYKREKFDMPAKVEAIEYDPNRTARIALLEYKDGEKRYIIAPNELKVGEEVMSSRKRVEIKVGNRMPLEHIPLGTLIYDIEAAPGKGAQLVRTAGSNAKLMAVEGDYATIRMPSTEVRLISKESMATIGQVSNPEAMHLRVGKAGRKRHMGIRPTVRGKAMNPVDHPHGGGEGSNPIGLKGPKTPWGKYALGVITRKRSKYSDKFIVSRRSKRK